MKLHCIRVTNLNSLYGEQQLDLDSDLQGASLFLIQGPTGSGKSTLMDAVSLALFGITPRLGGLRSEKEVAEQVMSRGTGICIAQLEFSKWSSSGEGRLRYRATWKARRARKKADGKMQDTDRSMERRLPDGSWHTEVSSSKKKDYGRVFAEVLEGFTPADFQRSMLLAQGQFDAMLHAKPEQRAAILERLTDTGDYQRLGERAARMRGAWQGRLATRKASRDAIAPLSGEALDTAKGALSKAEGELKTLEHRRVHLQAQTDWLVGRANLVADQTKAADALALVATRRQAAAAQLEALAAHEDCAESFTALSRYTDAQQALTTHQAEQKAVASSLPGLENNRKTSENRLRLATESATKAKEALERLRAPAQSAKEVQDQLAAAQVEVQRAQQELAKAKDDHVSTQEAAQRAVDDEIKAEGARLKAETEQTAQSAGKALVAPLAKLNERGAALGARAEALKISSEKAQYDEDKLMAEANTLAENHAEHEAQWETSVRPHKDAFDAALKHRKTLVDDADPETSLAELRARAVNIQRHQETLQQAQLALEAQATRLADQDARQAAWATAAVAHGEAVKNHETKAAALQPARDAVAAAERVLEPLQRIADLGTKRQNLTKGEPCPLCGSGEHPFVDDPHQSAQAAAIEQEIAKASAALKVKKQALEDARRGDGLAASAKAAMETTRDTAKAELDKAQAALIAATEQAQTALLQAGQEPQLGLEALAAEQLKARTQREDLQQRVSDVEAALSMERKAKQLRDEAVKAHEEQARKLKDEGVRQKEARSQLTARHAELETESTILTQKEARLRDDLAALGVHAASSREGLTEAQKRVDAWSAARDQHQAAVVARDQALAARENAATALAQSKTRHDESAKGHSQRKGVFETATDKAGVARRELERVWRAAAALDDPDAIARPLLDQPPSQLVRFQEDGVAKLEERRDAEQHTTNQSRDAHKGMVARQKALEEAEVPLAEAHKSRADELQQQLKIVSLPDISALVARRLQPPALSAAIATRDRLNTDTVGAQATAKKVNELMERHEQQRPEGLTDETTQGILAQAIAELMATRLTAQATLDTHRATVEMAARDEEALAKAQADLDADQASAEVWLHLHDLIGVGDGKRFKLFAQALNLDQLLTRANRHLEQLNKRYHLVTVPDKDTGLPSLEFKVNDSWRLGTTRSLKTLSGGESFLVSLALALGLSDLRTSSMPVETLLLDEGFGTLDPDTLETALAALKQLKASGRQVGIISHVVGLQEQIPARVRVEPLGEGRSRVLVG